MFYIKEHTEYIVVANHTGRVLNGYDTYTDAKQFATVLRQAGASVTIFKALEVKRKKGKLNETNQS